MPNGRNSQVQFRFQRPYANVYRVGNSSSNMYFTSIQAAINQAVADGFGIGNPAVVEIMPGTYTENLSLVPGIDVVGTYPGEMSEAGVTIVGDHTLVKNANAGIQLSNIYFYSFQLTNNPMFDISGINGGDIYFTNCSFFKRWAGVSRLVNLTTTSFFTMAFNNCSAGIFVDGGVMFDFSLATGGPSLRINGSIGISGSNGFTINNATAPNVMQNVFFKTPTVGGTFSAFQNMRISGVSSRFIELNSNANFSISNCAIEIAMAEGEFYRYMTNAYAIITNSSLLISDVGGETGVSAIARDGGDQANGLVTFVAQAIPGDTVTVNGTVFTAVAGVPVGNQFQIGATKEDTAYNLGSVMKGVGIGLTPAFYGFIVSGSNVLTVKAFDTGVAGNAITLSTTGGPRITVSGTTLAGGVNGGGGTLNYAGLAMTFPYVQQTLSVNQLATVAIPK